jgi:hypothetical protein
MVFKKVQPAHIQNPRFELLCWLCVNSNKHWPSVQFHTWMPVKKDISTFHFHFPFLWKRNSLVAHNRLRVEIYVRFYEMHYTYVYQGRRNKGCMGPWMHHLNLIGKEARPVTLNWNSNIFRPSATPDNMKCRIIQAWLHLTFT